MLISPNITSSNKLASMADEKVAPLPPSAAVSMEEASSHAPPADPPPPPPFPGVIHVIIWAFTNACAVAFFAGCDIKMMKEKDAAEVKVAVALVAGVVLCVMTQAAAAALALSLKLPRRPWQQRLRLVLAYAGLVATAAGHLVWAGLHGVVLADGGLCFWTAVITPVIPVALVGDVLCFRGLVLHGGEDEED